MDKITATKGHWNYREKGPQDKQENYENIVENVI